MILPHVLWHWLLEYDLIKLDAAAINAFWTELQARGISWACNDLFTPQHAPLGLFGDEARYVSETNESFLAITMSCLLWSTRGLDVWADRFPLFLLKSVVSLGHQTLQPVWRQLAWSLNCLATGCWPTCDSEGAAFGLGTYFDKMKGTPIGGRTNIPARLVEFRSDWKFVLQAFLLPVGPTSTQICHKCRATRTSSMEFAWDAPWTSTMRSTFEFITELNPASAPNALLAVWGFDLAMIRWCQMHCMALGVYLLINGAIFVLLRERHHWTAEGSSLEDSLKSCWRRFRNFCKANNVKSSQAPFRRSSLHYDPEYAFLNTKAYNARCILSFMAAEVSQYCLQNAGEPELLLAANTAILFDRWQHQMEAAPRFLSEGQAIELCSLGQDALDSYKAAAEMFLRMGKLLFPMRPKLHEFDHLRRDALLERYNPRFYHCFRDEDTMKHLKRLCQASHFRTLELSVLARYYLRIQYPAEISSGSSSSSEESSTCLPP